ncbi:MAG: DnaJ domain-containing protein [Legionellaceae bacterium]|nr:DnaJ domain-containing protein [Legionellaceae bacterium]
MTPDTIFEILGIASTNNFRAVKRAYLTKAIEWHPDKHTGKSNAEREEYQEKFKILVNAYEKVNSQERLNAYLSGSHRDESSHEPHVSQPQPKKSPVPESTNALRKPGNASVNIFVALPFSHFSECENDAFLSVDRNRLQESLDFNRIAETLSKLSKLRDLQVGTTYEEAEEIENQHSHRFEVIIVEVTVSLNRLSDEKYSEKEKYIGSVNAKENPFFWLLQNSLFESNDIIVIRRMEHYINSIKFGWRGVPIIFGTKNLEKPIYNPQYTPQSALANDHDRPGIAAGELSSVSLFCRVPLGITGNEAYQPSALSQEQLSRIDKQAQVLRTEINHWFSFNKERKQHQIDALTSLVEYAKTETVPMAIKRIEKEYPDVRAGINSRTSALLDSLIEESNTATPSVKL